MMALNNAWKKVINAVKAFGNAIGICTRNARCIAYEVKVTKYSCDVCQSMLILVGHNSDEIIYKCGSCGKIHKAKKGNVLGRFRK